MNKIYKVIWSKTRNCYVAVSEIAKRNGKDRTSVTGGAAGRRQAARVLCALLLGAYLTAGYSMPVAWGADGYVIRDGDTIVWGKGTTLSQEVVGAQKTIIINVREGTNVTADASGVHVIGSETLTNDGKLMTGTAVTTALSSYTKKSDLSAGNGLSLSGTTYSVKANGNSITVGSAGIKVSDTITGDINSLKTTVGDTSSGLVKDVNDNKTALQSKANAATTLAGYGITDAYTKSETDTALAAKADAADVSALNTKTQYVASAGENKTTIAGTLEVVGTNAESGGVINVSGPGSGVNIAGTESFLKVGNGSANYALEVDVGNNQVKAASGNIVLDSNGALTTKYSGQTVFEVKPVTDYTSQLTFNGGISGKATFNGSGDYKVTLQNGAITATGAISGKTITATDNLYIGTGTDQINVATAVAGSGVIAATGETGASGLVKGSTVYDYLNGAKLDLGAESTQIEIGQNSTASGNYAIAIGTDATTATTTASESSIAIGKSAEAKSGYTIAMGTNAKVASGTGTIAIGYNANASGNDTATAIGSGATAWQGTAIGWGANANGAGATALGGFADANSEYATAVGLSAKATSINAVAIGRGAEASRVDSENPSIYLSTESATALGAFSKAQSDYATAVGANAKASGLNSIAIGGGTRPDTGTITAATAVGEGSIAIGKGANTTAEQATAVGMNTSAVANGTAIGYNAKANKNTSTAIGYGAKADGNGENATAIGYDSSATGNTSIAIAGSASASLAIAVGRSTSATAERAIGIGVETAASGIRSVAIGSETSASAASSVALGSNSVANRADYATTNYKAYLNEDDSKTDSAWRSTHSAVAVGNGTTATRQITGVAAGSEDTDAVNVAQLKSATPMINSEHNYYDGSTTAVKVTDAVNAMDAGLGAKITADGNYIKASATNPINANIQALDTALGAKITTDGNYIRVANSINANISALDTQAKTNADNIATLQTTATATTAAIGTLSDDGNYIKKTSAYNVAQNLAALDTAVGKTTAGNYITATDGTAANSLATQVQALDTAAGTFRDKIQNITATAGTTTMKGVLNVIDSTGATTGVAIDGTGKTITAGGVVINGAANTMAVGDVAVNGAAKTITTGNVTIDGAANSITLNGASNTLKVGGVTISDNGTAKTITGLSNTTWDADNITSGQAATEDQLKAATISLTNGGLKFTANSGGTVTNKLGSTVGVIGGGSKEDDKYSESNVKTVIAQDATGNSTITVKLDKDPSFDSVTATGKVQGASLTDGTATLTGGALSNVTDLTANGTATFGSGTSTVIVSGGAVTATGNISGADITASGMLSSASLKVNGVDVTTPLSTAGAVVSGNAGFVTGGTVYSEVRPATDGNYVKTANSTAANLTALDSAIGMVAADGNYIKKSATNNVSQNVSALDTQVKTNADNIAMLQSSTTAAVGTLTEDGNYIKKSDTNNVVQNLSALDTQAKTNADNIAANKTAIGTTADGSYVKAANTVGKNLNALDTQVKKNSDDIATLQNSITVEEDPSGVKITTIEGNLVIKEEDGTKKDVTAALSTDGEVAKQGDAGSEGYLKGETVYDYLNKGENGKEVKLATESKNISMGQGSKATGKESIAIGNETDGQSNEASGTQSIAIGFGNKVSGAHSGAIGDPNIVNGDNSYVVGNSSNVADGLTDVFVLGNNVNVTGSNTVVLGSGSDGSESNVVSVGATGKERRITHVAPGKEATDAATWGQVQEVAQGAYNNAVNLSNSINNLDSRLNKVGAGAAALAALHPIDTDDKFTMGLGYGNYRSANAMAMGMFYRPTEKIMISVGGAFGNGENMVNAGISFALDKGKGFGTSKAAMARKIAAQDEEIAALKEAHAKENAENKAEIQALKEALARLEAKIGK